MKLFRKPLFVILVLVVAMNGLTIIGMVAAQDHSAAPHWTYEGEAAPTHWGDLSEAFALCSDGMEQSPIDILAPASENLPDIQFNYQPSALTIKNNGHTIQVDYAEGSSITVDGTEYALLQFHFHHPSEHTIEGVIYPLEVHFVHADADGNLAVVGMMIKEGTEANAAFESVWANLPTEETEPTAIDSTTVNAADILPADHLFYTYSGSLTTPPCSEGVHWMVLTAPITMSVEQLTAFSDIFSLNARPVQRLNERAITADSGADS